MARSFQNRMFSSAVSAKAETSQVTVDREPKYELNRLSNGLAVAAIDTPCPVPRVAVVVKSGPRNETGDMIGISHCLRHAGHLKTARLTQTGITRTMQQMGSDITIEGNREYTLYKSNAKRHFIPDCVTVLREVTTNQQFRRWETEDMQADPHSLTLELLALKSQPQVGLMELLHKAAFRGGLGNSLYMPDYQIGNFAASDLQSWCEGHYTEGRLALVGVGVDLATLEALGQQFQLREPSTAVGGASPAAFLGGEVREDRAGDLSYVALALPGPSNGDKSLLAGEVLKFLLGAGSSIKRSQYSGTLGAAARGASDAPHAVASVSASYSDAGLIGFTAVAPSSEIDKVTKAAASKMQEVLSKPVSEADVTKAKASLKCHLSSQLSQSDNLLNWIGEQAMSGGQLLTVDAVLAMVDAVTAADVNAAAKSMLSGKAAMAAVGNVENVPYLDQLIK